VTAYDLMFEQVLDAFYTCRPPLVWGPPGVGKSAFARWVARRLNLKLFIVYLSHKADNEVHGQPVVAKATVSLAGSERTVVEQAPPRYVIDALLALNEKDAQGGPLYKGSLIVYEELTTVQPAVAAPALAIFADNVIADIQMPDDVFTMACANPASQAVGGWDLQLPSSRRFQHVHFQLSPKAWVEHFPGNWGAPVRIGRPNLPELPPEEVSRDRAVVGAYIEKFPDALFRLPKESAKGTGCWTESGALHTGGWPNPAAWEGVAGLLTANRLAGHSHSSLQASVIGNVGHEAGTQFMVWRDKMDLPSPREVLAKPELVSKVPVNRSDQLYYLVLACVEQIKHQVAKHLARPKDKKLRDEAVAAWRPGWEVVGRAALGPLNGAAYPEAVKDVLGGRRAMKGPLDIASIGVFTLARECRVTEAPVAEVPEIGLFVPILKAAGLDWSADGNRRR
jgi:hypothetical protein